MMRMLSPLFTDDDEPSLTSFRPLRSFGLTNTQGGRLRDLEDGDIEVAVARDHNHAEAWFGGG